MRSLRMGAAKRGGWEQKERCVASHVLRQNHMTVTVTAILLLASTINVNELKTVADMYLTSWNLAK